MGEMQSKRSVLSPLLSQSCYSDRTAADAGEGRVGGSGSGGTVWTFLKSYKWSARCGCSAQRLGGGEEDCRVEASLE